MGKIEPWVVKQFVAAAQALDDSMLYERFSDQDCFLLRLPGLDEPALAMLMGHGGETYGLTMLLGPQAVASFEALVASGGGARARHALARSHMLGYQVCDARDLSHDARRWLKKAKVRPSGDGLYPDPISMEPGKVPRALLHDSETRLLLWAVRGIMAAALDKRFDPCGISETGRVLCVTVSGDAASPTVSFGWETVAVAGGSTSPRATPAKTARGGASSVAGEIPGTAPGAAPGAVPGAIPGAVRLAPRFDLSGLASSGDRWLVATVPAPARVDGDDRQPYFIIVCSEQAGGVWPMIHMGGEPEEVVEELAKLMKGQVEPREGDVDVRSLGAVSPLSGLPAALTVDSRELYEAARAAFGPLGVVCHDGRDDPALQAMLDDFGGSIAAAVGQGDADDSLEEMPAELDELDHPPAADDLDGWKQVDGWLKDAVHEAYDTDDRFLGTRALNRYFGPDADGEDLLDKYQRNMVVDSYAMWFVVDYRSARNRPTLAEQWLEGEPAMPGAVRELLKAVAAQGPSLYRVVEADEDTGKLTMQDLFTGELTIATDFSLSTCVEPGEVLPARLVPVGSFHFFFAAGPLLNGAEVARVMELFDWQRITPSTETFAKQPHVLGLLWRFVDELRRGGVNMRNTDGHEMLFHTARFACSDPSALRRWLESRPDWESDDDGSNVWVWYREQTAGPGKPGQRPRTLLGRVELAKRVVTATANSRERYAVMRGMLEQVPGVLFESGSVQTLSELAAAGGGPGIAGDEVEVPDAMDSDDAAATNRYIEDHYRRWLDMPLPLLRNKTPRQAAQDAKLRPQLAAMVRAIPDPIDHSTNTPIHAPRAMLLNELGLD